ncbi:MAG: hypothetical protein IKO95_06560 [Spirochaetia bacterium]|nr:hypothetical protein [Spirochaetia bacterium]
MSDKIIIKKEDEGIQRLEVSNEVVDRLNNIFRRVIWRDPEGKNEGYFDINKDISFHKDLCDKILEKKVSDYSIVEIFYSKKKDDSKYEYLLPPEKEFKQIDINEFNTFKSEPKYTEGGYYYLFNKCFIEKNFVKNLGIPTNKEDGFFPLWKEYEQFEKKEWICQYLYRQARFNWYNSGNINFYYKPAQPWVEFYHFCQFCYTLVRAGLEVKKDNKGKQLKEYKNDGYKYLIDRYLGENIKKINKIKKIISDTKGKTSKKQDSSLEKLEKEYSYIMGNIEYGIEDDSKPFHIKSLKETILQINFHKVHNSYQKYNFFSFDSNDCESIKNIYKKLNDKDSEGDYNISLKNYSQMFDYILKHISQLSKEDKDTITYIFKKKNFKKNPECYDKDTETEGNDKDTEESENNASPEKHIISGSEGADEIMYKKAQEEKIIKITIKIFCKQFPFDERFVHWLNGLNSYEELESFLVAFIQLSKKGKVKEDLAEKKVKNMLIDKYNEMENLKEYSDEIISLFEERVKKVKDLIKRKYNGKNDLSE